MSKDVRVGIVGATGALGGELLRVLDQAPWRPETVVALARAATATSHVQYGDERVVVDDVAHQVLEDLDLVFLAVPVRDAREVGERIALAGVPMVDLSGVFVADGDVPRVVPWVNPEALEVGPRRIASVPSPAGTLLSCVLGPLVRAGLAGRASATVMLPASASGRDGIDELSRQVTALFNGSTPPRKVFPGGLAFDLDPAVGAIGDDGWTRTERRAVEEVQGITGWQDLTVTTVGAPLFSGVAATLQLDLPRAVPLELLRQILVDGGLKLPEDESVRQLPRPRRLEGQPFPHVGRLRVDEAGRIHMWLGMDNLRATAAVAAAVGAALL